MKHQPGSRVLNLSLPSKSGLVLILSAALAGCANIPATIPARQQDEIQAKKPEVAPDNPEIKIDFDSAMTLINSGKYDQGIALLKKVTEKSKGNPVPYINLAIAYEKLGDLKLAEEYIRSALNLDPDNPVAGNEYAVLCRKTGRFSKARELYEAVLKKYPKFNMAHRNLGVLCDLYLRDYECALKQYEIYSSAMPDDKEVKIWVADLKKRMGQ